MIGYTPRGHFVDRDRLLYAGDEPEYCDTCEGRIRRDDTCRCVECEQCGVMQLSEICRDCEDRDGEVK
jgi:hypothetical protein